MRRRTDEEQWRAITSSVTRVHPCICRLVSRREKTQHSVPFAASRWPANSALSTFVFAPELTSFFVFGTRGPEELTNTHLPEHNRHSSHQHRRLTRLDSQRTPVRATLAKSTFTLSGFLRNDTERETPNLPSPPRRTTRDPRFASRQFGKYGQQ